ncbi:MAG: hypothetical protein HY508_12430 [Acidobacteria bacterium]|nr:hypothetical protein [Acidobacteriota bacterium]
MKKYLFLFISALVLAVAGMPSTLHAQKGFEVVKGKAFEDAIPGDFYLEGSRIPVQKRNAALVKTPAGARVVIGLIDTSGYSSHFQQKYEGMIISEGNFTVCGQKVGVGSFGFGNTKPMATSNEDMKLMIYDQAGAKVGECSGKKDASLAKPSPLQIVIGNPSKLYLGRYGFDLK